MGGDGHAASTRSTRSSGSTSPAPPPGSTTPVTATSCAPWCALQQTERLDTWPLVLVRHAHALAREHVARPTTRCGPSTPAAASAPRRWSRCSAAYGVTRVVTSPSVRCLRHRPAVCRRCGAAACAPVPGCPRRGSPSSPTKAHRHLDPAARARRAGAAVHPRAGAAGAARRARAAARPRRRRLGRGRRGVRRGPRRRSLAKGEALVSHVVGTGARPGSSTSSATAPEPGTAGSAPCVPAAHATSRLTVRTTNVADAVHGPFTRREAIASPSIPTFLPSGTSRPTP